MMPLRLGLFVAALSMPQMALACGQLSAHVWMCARGTVWETATWEQHGDGATIRMQEFTFDFSEQFPGTERANSETTIEELYGYYAEFLKDNYDDDALRPEVIRSGWAETEHLRAKQVLQRGISPWNGLPFLETAMLAQVGEHKILLELKGPADMDLPKMDAAAAEVLSFLRSSCADPVSCADDYEWPPEAPLKEL